VRQIVNLARRGRVLLLPIIVAAVAAAVAACGGSSNNASDTSGGGGGSAQARQILKETFQGKHPVKSGTMDIALTLTPSGSSVFKTPISLSLSGPFQSNGSGKIPDSDFKISGEAEGHAIDLQLISAGGHGYITVDNTSYELPQADYERLESRFSSVPGSSQSSDSGELGKLGIDPMDWLTDPTVAGSASVGGTATTKVDAAVNTDVLLRDISKVLSHSSSLGVSSSRIPTKLSASEMAQIAQTVGHPRFSVWSANSDHSLRRLQLTDHLTVNGEISSAIGGLSGLGVNFSFGYADVNQPQTITAPTNLKPYSQFSAKIAEVKTALEYLAIEAESGESGSSTTGSGSGSKYTRCVEQAGSSITKLQKCQSDL
jgi:hypothetical protein